MLRARDIELWEDPDGNGWRRAPAGNPHVIEGERIYMEKGSTLHDNTTAENSCRLGERAEVGPNSRLGRNVRLMNGVNVSQKCDLGHGTLIMQGSVIYDNCKLPPNSFVGPNTKVPEECRFTTFLGFDNRGYGFQASWREDGGLFVTAGCREFTFAHAVDHWAEDNEGGEPENNRLIQAMLTVARVRCVDIWKVPLTGEPQGQVEPAPDVVPVEDDSEEEILADDE